MSGTMDDAHSPWNASRFPRRWEAKADALEAAHSRGHLRWGTCRQEVLPGGVVLTQLLFSGNVVLGM